MRATPALDRLESPSRFAQAGSSFLLPPSTLFYIQETGKFKNQPRIFLKFQHNPGTCRTQFRRFPASHTLEVYILSFQKLDLANFLSLQGQWPQAIHKHAYKTYFDMDQLGRLLAATFEHNPSLPPKEAEARILGFYRASPYAFLLECLPRTISVEHPEHHRLALINILTRFLYDDLDQDTFSQSQRSSLLQAFILHLGDSLDSIVASKLGACVELMLTKERKLDLAGLVLVLCENSLGQVNGQASKFRTAIELFKALINSVSSSDKLYEYTSRLLPGALSLTFSFTKHAITCQTNELKNAEVLSQNYQLLKLIIDRLQEEGLQGSCLDIIQLLRKTPQLMAVLTQMLVFRPPSCSADNLFIIEQDTKIARLLNEAKTAALQIALTVCTNLLQRLSVSFLIALNQLVSRPAMGELLLRADIQELVTTILDCLKEGLQSPAQGYYEDLHRQRGRLFQVSVRLLVISKHQLDSLSDNAQARHFFENEIDMCRHQNKETIKAGVARVLQQYVLHFDGALSYLVQLCLAVLDSLLPGPMVLSDKPEIYQEIAALKVSEMDKNALVDAAFSILAILNHPISTRKDLSLLVCSLLSFKSEILSAEDLPIHLQMRLYLVLLYYPYPKLLLVFAKRHLGKNRPASVTFQAMLQQLLSQNKMILDSEPVTVLKMVLTTIPPSRKVHQLSVKLLQAKLTPEEMTGLLAQHEQCLSGLATQAISQKGSGNAAFTLGLMVPVIEGIKDIYVREARLQVRQHLRTAILNMVGGLVKQPLRGLSASVLRLFMTVSKGSNSMFVGSLILEASRNFCLQDYTECVWTLMKEDVDRKAVSKQLGLHLQACIEQVFRTNSDADVMEFSLIAASLAVNYGLYCRTLWTPTLCTKQRLLSLTGIYLLGGKASLQEFKTLFIDIQKQNHVIDQVDSKILCIVLCKAFQQPRFLQSVSEGEFRAYLSVLLAQLLIQFTKSNARKQEDSQKYEVVINRGLVSGYQRQGQQKCPYQEDQFEMCSRLLSFWKENYPMFLKIAMESHEEAVLKLVSIRSVNGHARTIHRVKRVP